jgi:amphi-Trp domain-containing protein
MATLSSAGGIYLVADKQSIKFNGTMDIHKVAACLEGLAKGLQDGRIMVDCGDSALTLDVASEVALELEAASKRDKSSIEITVNWPFVHSRAAQGSSPGLLIGGGKELAQPDEQPTPEFKAFNLSTRQECTILNPEIVTMKNGRKMVQGLASDDRKTKVTRILSADVAADADQFVKAAHRSNGRRAHASSKRSS